MQRTILDSQALKYLWVEDLWLDLNMQDWNTYHWYIADKSPRTNHEICEQIAKHWFIMPKITAFFRKKWKTFWIILPNIERFVKKEVFDLRKFEWVTYSIKQKEIILFISETINKASTETTGS